MEQRLRGVQVFIRIVEIVVTDRSISDKSKGFI